MQSELSVEDVKWALLVVGIGLIISQYSMRIKGGRCHTFRPYNLLPNLGIQFQNMMNQPVR